MCDEEEEDPPTNHLGNMFTQKRDYNDSFGKGVKINFEVVYVYNESFNPKTIDFQFKRKHT